MGAETMKATAKKINSGATSPALREKKRPLRVALIVETSTLFGRRLLSGVAQYMRENAEWSVYFTDRAVNDSPPAWIAKWRGDGIITRIASPEIRSVLASRKIPVVDLNEQLGGLGVPLISNDHAAVGKLAARHLMERGFQQFAYVGHAGHRWSDRRQAAFAQTVKRAGYPCAIYEGRKDDVRALREGVWENEVDRIAKWVAALPKPVGVMACNDFRALQLLSACTLADVAVPEQAAVIGVGADDVACELAHPPLSSVMLNAWRMGYEAASLLDRMMHGEAAPKAELLVPPLDVIGRRSTDVTAIADPIVAEATRFIREHACERINVETVLERMGVSRTSLQEHFKRAMNKSIHDVLIEARLGRVKELLAETELPIEKIAVRCGFRHPEYMSSVFRLRTGRTPASFRREHGRKPEWG